MLNKVSFLIGPKGDDYHLIQKVIHELQGGEFNVTDLLSLDQFSGTEKKRLQALFDGDFSLIYAWDSQFVYEDRKWKYSKSAYDHEHAVKKLLVLMNKRSFSPGTIVSTSDLSLIRTLLSEWDGMFVRDWETSRGDKAPRFEITWEALQLISDNMKQRIGEYSTFNFDFVKTFLEAFHDYNSIIIGRIILGTNKPK
jgi:hypothetical protein